MAYKVDLKYPVYRSTSIDEVQGYADLQMIWTAIRESEKGKRDPLSPESIDKIYKGLKRTMCEGKNRRTRTMAANIILAIGDEDWNRNVKPTRTR